MEPAFVRTRNALRALGPQGSLGLQLFERFSELLSITEESLQSKWKQEHQCCNPLCELREKEQVGVLKKCRACDPADTVYYHGTVCQKA